jgi:hypothetical protein
MELGTPVAKSFEKLPRRTMSATFEVRLLLHHTVRAAVSILPKRRRLVITSCVAIQRTEIGHSKRCTDYTNWVLCEVYRRVLYVCVLHQYKRDFETALLECRNEEHRLRLERSISRRCAK